MTIDCGSPPLGTRGSFYSYQMPVSGVAPYTVVISSGDLPIGLTIDNSALISGTPMFAMTSWFTVFVTDSVGDSASVECAISVQAVPIFLGCGNPPTGSVGSPYSHQMDIAGGSPPFFVQVYNGFMPPGLSIDSLLHITGIPGATGTYPFTVKVTEAGALGRATEVTCSISIGPNALSFNCNNPPTGMRGVPYSHQMAIIGGVAPYTVSVMSGSLPDGLAISNTALVTGTPMFAMTGFFTVLVRDAWGTSFAADCQISIGAVAIFLDCNNPPGGNVGAPYSHQMTLVGGSGPFFVQVYNGFLPPGLSIDSLVHITGVPGATGTYPFTVKVTEAGALGRATEVTCTISIAPSGIRFDCSAPGTFGPPPPTGAVGVFYSHQLTLIGGTPPYIINLTGGTFTTGLTFDNTGLITGIPMFAGTDRFTLKATDSLGNSAFVECYISIAAVAIYLDCNNPPNGRVGANYSHQMTLIGGAGPFFIQIYNGTLPPGPNTGILPPGLSIDSLAKITGRPTAEGTYQFTVKVTEAGALGRATEVQCSISIGPGLTFTCANSAGKAPPTGTRGKPYSHQMVLSGGVAPYTISVTGGTFTTGLSISNTALITGTPMFAGTDRFTLTAVDSVDVIASVDCFISIGAVDILLDCADPNTELPPPTGAVGLDYEHQMTLEGGSGPFFVQVYAGSLLPGPNIGILPPGLSIDSAVMITGVPTLAGTFTFTVKVTEAGALGRATEVVCEIIVKQISDEAACEITIHGPLQADCNNPPLAAVDVEYSHQIIIMGGTGPYTVEIVC